MARNREVQMLQNMLNSNAQSPMAGMNNQNGNGVDGKDIDNIPKAEISNTPQAAGQQSITRGPEQELNDNIKENAVVVNKARNQNKMTGMAQLLQQPAIQNALLEMGKAFVGGKEGTAATSLAQGGQALIRQTANQRAQKAFEEGEDIAQAAGQFADPKLVSRLQQQQQQKEQFDQRMEIKEQGLDIERTRLLNDSVYRFAKQQMDGDMAEARIQNMEKQAKIDQQVADARQAYWESIANQEEGNAKNLALRTNKFIEVLDKRKSTYDQEVRDIKNMLSDLDVDLDRSTIQSLKSGDITVDQVDISSADDSNLPLYSGQGQQKAQALVGQLDTVLRQKSRTESTLNNLESVQSARLGAGSGQPSPDTGGGGDNDQQNTPVGTQDAPVKLSYDAAVTKPQGSWVNIAGTTYRIAPDGRPLPPDEYDEFVGGEENNNNE